MDFKFLSNIDLITELKNAVLEERKFTTKVLHLLKQVEARRIYLDRGFDSLFSFTVKFLGYSEAAAHRRISAMRALKEIPELEDKILSGDLTLTNIAQVAVFIRNESKTQKISADDKTKLFEEVEGKSTRECEKILLAKSPETIPQSKRRELTETKTEVKVVLCEDLIKQLDRLKDLWGHKKSEMTDAELIEEMAKFCLSKVDPLLKQVKTPAPGQESRAKGARSIELSAEAYEEDQMFSPGELPTKPNEQSRNEMLSSPVQKPTAPKQNKNIFAKITRSKRTRYIPVAIKIAIWKRDQGKCQFKDPLTGKNCHSTKYLELEHQQPLVLGGTNTLDNLQLLCRAHNFHKATQLFQNAKRYLRNGFD